MTRKILIVSYSHIQSDPRVMRQIHALRDHYSIETAGLSDSGIPSIPNHVIYTAPAFSILRKIKRLFLFLFRFYDAYYWDDGKKNLLKQFSAPPYDLVIANDIYTLPLAIQLARNPQKVYFDAHEYHPLEFEDLLFWKLFYAPYNRFLCRKYIPMTGAFSTVSESIAQKYEQFTGKKPLVITNATAYYDLLPTPVKPDAIRLVHHGGAIRSRKIERMIEVAALLDERFQVDLMLLSKDPAYLQFLKNKAGQNPRIRFIDPVPTHEIATFTNQYDLGLFLLPPTNLNYLNALPNKLFEFVQARLGIIISPNHEMARFVDHYTLGRISPDYTASSMARIINALSTEEIETFKQNSHRIARMESSENNTKKINEIITGLLQNSH